MVKMLWLYILSGILLLNTLGRKCTADDEHFISFAPGVQIPGEKIVSTKDPTKYGYAYYGVRYATAKRFENPVENTDFSYLNNASRPKLGPVCPQHGEPGFERDMIMDEDCLYLDVFVPIVSHFTGRLPVALFIYGGALQAGDKDIYNGAFLAMEIDAVYVAINYRVSVFGFLSTGDEALPGNYGLGDCKMALNWVATHIQKFNGDPHQITVFGQSAGGILTSALYMDLSTRRLLRSAVAMSGSVLMDKAFTRNPKERTFEVAEKLNCSHKVTKDMVECRKRLPMMTVLNVARRIPDENKEMIPYGLVLDRQHFIQHPRLSIESLPSDTTLRNFVSGYLREDLSGMFLITNPELFNPASPVTYDILKESVAKQFLPTYEKCTTPNYELAERVMRFYKMSETDGTADLMLKYYRLSSDATFGYASMKESFLYAKRNARQHEEINQFFFISYDQKHSDFGAFHGMELHYIFGDPFNSMFFNLTLDETVQKSLLDMLKQVVHNGYKKNRRTVFVQHGEYMELKQSGAWEEGNVKLDTIIAFWDSVVATPCPTIGARISKEDARSDEL